jgi:hypothetical protein
VRGGGTLAGALFVGSDARDLVSASEVVRPTDALLTV